MKPAALLLAPTLFVSCSEKAPDYPEQLKTIFSNRIGKLDSAAVLDAFRLIRMQPITAQLGLKINDSVYKFTYYKVVNQMTAAKASGHTDSIAFYQEELNYMQGQLDSFTTAIEHADTADSKFGQFAMCSYDIKRNGKTHSDTAYFFFDKHMNLLNAESLDSMASRSLYTVR